jgi:5-methylthioribose kinase
MQFIPPPAVILRKSLVAGTRLPLVTAHLATFLARTLFHSSALHVGVSAFSAKVATATNVELCRLTEAVVFTDPYVANDKAAFPNRWTAPQLDRIAGEIKADTALKTAMFALKEKFVTHTQALVHGDLHTGSVMASPAHTVVIDPEFAFYGPMGFDVGALLANIFLAYCSQPGHASAGSPPLLLHPPVCHSPPAEDTRVEYQQWLADQASDLWAGLHREFTSLWASDDPARPADALYSRHMFDSESDHAACQTAFMHRLLQDSLGFAGAKMVWNALLASLCSLLSSHST